MVELILIVFQFVVIFEMFDSMLLFEFVHYFQFVHQYHEYFVRILQNDYEKIYEIHINVQFHEAKNEKFRKKKRFLIYFAEMSIAAEN